ncbi:MAG TPA: LysR family transcriptional regulator [Usitatibacter sp.]|nr:LysR family transcriptional regulator [Usitatibacter sp.]
MELYQIRYFLAICEYGSFSRAAEACEVSQPALTAAMKKLESEMGAILLHREGKRLVVTELGSRLRPHLEQALGETRLAESLARNFRLLKQAPLRVGAMSTIGPAQLARCFESFRNQNPGIELTVREAPFTTLLRELEADELDLALVSAPQGLADAFRSETLYRERYVVIFPPGHPFEQLERISLQDTAGKEYIDRLACELRETVRAVCSERKIELYAAFRSDREDWIQSMVLAGLGFAFMPEYSVTLKGVLSRPLVDPPVQRAILAAEMRGRNRSPATKLLFDAMRDYPWPELTGAQDRRAAKSR